MIKTECNKPLIMTKKDHEDLKNSTKRWIYIKTYEEGKVKLKNNDHVTGKYRWSVHWEYDLNLCLSKKVSVVFYNL